MGGLVPFHPRDSLAQSDSPQRHSIPDGYPQERVNPRTVSEYLALIRRQKWIVLASALFFLGLAAWRVSGSLPLYSANAVIRLADARKAMTGGASTDPNDEALGNDTDLLLSQIQVMSSRAVASDAVEASGLRLTTVPGQPILPWVTDVQVAPYAPSDSVYLIFNPSEVVLRFHGQEARAPYGQPVSVQGLTLTLSRRPAAPSAIFQVVPQSAAAASVRGGFSAQPRPKTNVVDLQFTSTNPEYAKRAVNAMAVTFQHHNAESARQASRRRRIFLEEQRRQADVLLTRAMADYDAYRSGQKVFSSKEKATAQQAGMNEVDMRRADLFAQRRTYQSLLSQAQAERTSQSGESSLNALVSAPGIAANPVIAQLYSQLSGYEQKRDSVISGGAAETSPDVTRYTKLISSTVDRLVAAVRYQIQALDAQIEALDDLKTRSTAEIQSAPKAETEEARLAQQVQSAQKMADQLKEDEQQARMAEAVEAGQVEIVDLADEASGPLSSGGNRKLALGLVFGLLVGITGAVIIDGMNTSIRRRDDLERVLKVPGLAVIPRFVAKHPRGRLGRALPSGSKRNGNGTGRVAGLVTVLDGRSAGAEAYRTLRTNLIFAEAQQSLRTIVVTSAAPSEGKTTTAANLAVSYAQQGMRVLLADCDLRRSRVHRMFSVPRVPGLTECVLANLEPESVARQTPIIGLYVLPSGEPPVNPSELLGGEAMRKTLAKLSEAFDVVIMDTPPILVASDATILATLADGVVLVVRAGVTEAEAGYQAMQQLSAVGARVVGAVLNDPDEKLQSYGGYYKYEYASES